MSPRQLRDLLHEQALADYPDNAPLVDLPLGEFTEPSTLPDCIECGRELCRAHKQAQAARPGWVLPGTPRTPQPAPAPIVRGAGRSELYGVTAEGWERLRALITGQLSYSLRKWRIASDLIPDLAADVIASLVRQLNDGAHIPNPAAYARRSAKNAAIDWLKHHRVERRAAEAYEATGDPESVSHGDRLDTYEAAMLHTKIDTQKKILKAKPVPQSSIHMRRGDTEFAHEPNP